MRRAHNYHIIIVSQKTSYNFTAQNKKFTPLFFSLSFFFLYLFCLRSLIYFFYPFFPKYS
ncbi:hypothetical protein BCR42DRAFT_403039, partial [Absidia repens]